MENRLKDALCGAEGNYILPFYWQHGKEEELIREGMEKIFESGIGAVCVESRPHPDFLGDKWWADMDVIMDEARKRNMRVWVLDDAHFPTGYCNGKIYITKRHLPWERMSGRIKEPERKESDPRSRRRSNETSGLLRQSS